MTMIQSLLEAGYFPRELPPPFTTLSFAAYALLHGSNWHNAWTHCVTHNLARPGGLRRTLEIPNPVSFFHLANVTASGWPRIYSHTRQVLLSASRPYVMNNSPRAVISRYSMRERPRLRALRRRSDRYLLRADLSQFYPSLYTHAIGWALEGKKQCKAALLTPGKGSHLLGNQIDAAHRFANDGQTHGIPIGPDTSLVAAEILLAAVDEQIVKRHGNSFRGFHYIDDYELSFRTLSEAEVVLNDLQGILGEFDLVLNPRKTKMMELPQLLSDDWVIRLSRFEIEDALHPQTQRNDVLNLFSTAYELASAHREDPVIGYAVARVQNLNISAAGWRAFQNCILGAISADASCISRALGTLHQAGQAGNHAVAKAPLGDTLEAVIGRHASRGEGSEVAWALWGALAWSISLSVEAGRLVSAMADDLVALLALDAEARGLFSPGALNKQLWQGLVNEADVLHGEHWLLSFEANQKAWLACPAVASHPVFDTLHKAHVSFYDPSRNIPQYPQGGNRVPGGILPDYYA